MPKAFTTLEKNILKAKGVSDSELKKLIKAGISSRGGFAIVGDAATLRELVGLKLDVARAVMSWALGGKSVGPAVVDTADVVYCVHCRAKQPKDYKSGDLCGACGKQAEPILTCYWCAASGPGTFCRGCGAEYVATGELELAILLKRDGLAKDAIPSRLKGMSAAEKEALWGRVRRGR
jgi:hypothetical protein